MGGVFGGATSSFYAPAARYVLSMYDLSGKDILSLSLFFFSVFRERREKNADCVARAYRVNEKTSA